MPAINWSANDSVSFTGRKKLQESLDEYLQYDNIAQGIEDNAIAIAKKYNNKEVNHFHFIMNALDETLDYINKLDSGEEDLYYLEDEASAPSYFTTVYPKTMFSDKRTREILKQVITEEHEGIDSILKSLPKDESSANIKICNSFYNDLEVHRSLSDKNNEPVDIVDIYNAAFSSDMPEVRKINDRFISKMLDVAFIEKTPLSERLYFPTYDKIANNVINNLAHGTNMVITYDEKKIDPNYFVPSIIKAFENSKHEKLNNKNTRIVEFNKDTLMSALVGKVKEFSKNKNQNYIILFSEKEFASKMEINGIDASVFYPSDDYINILKNPPKNIHLVAFETKDNYLKYSQGIGDLYSEAGEVSIPVMESKDVLKAFQNNKEFIDKISPNLSKPALNKIVSLSTQMDGAFPNKTINLLKKVSSNYIDKKEITSKDVEKYAKNAEHLFKQSDESDSSVEIIFDTGKRLKDIVGKTNTKKEAENVVKQIKNKSIGTKGYILYNEDGMAGGGRRHTAQAIAGEAGVPFVSINTMDFGTKDVDLFGGSIMSPEASIKKLFSLVSTQANANPHKSAVLFIENFEYFSVGELVSEYHQKAMAQLIREMDNAEKKGLNIVVMGSVSSPTLIGEAAMKSFKFNDNIEVSSPYSNESERYTVLKHFSKENKLKLSGTPEEQEKLLKDMSKTLKGFSFIELKSFMKKAEAIAQEFNHKEITKSDMIESYLRITTGRPATGEINPHEKELVTKHECGHAVALQIMNDLMKKTGKQWLLPDTVNFITLDPRGNYGGAMYHKSDSNIQYSFEKNFTDIVCSYGGHSAEKYFYDMDGSYGISSDLACATDMAEAMVQMMGQGIHTGKISLLNVHGDENFSRNITPELRARVEKDINIITRNALTVSDQIVETYSDFINEFADKYAHLVGTGDCLIDGDVFRQELADWKVKQSPEKLEELELLDEMILEIIKYSKKGKIFWNNLN